MLRVERQGSRTVLTTVLAIVLGIGLLTAAPALAQELICNDGIDNDGDQQIDCADTDCAGVGTCPVFSTSPLFSLRPPLQVPFDESDLLSSTPLLVFFPAANLGLFGVLLDDLNAFSSGATLGNGAPPLGLLHFSVSQLSVGVGVRAPDVFSEATVGQAAADIYASARVGFNYLVWNQADLGPAPALPTGGFAIPPIDDIDALDLPSGFIGGGVFALATGHPHIGPMGLVGCGGDLFTPPAVLPGPPMPAFAFGPPGFGLGLASCADDVDALHFATGPQASFYFSLAPGSPSLLPGSPIAGCLAGCSPADIFAVLIAAPGAAVRIATAADLGLLPNDDVDAMAWPDCAAPGGADLDLDGVSDVCDNCIGFANPGQHDSDVDGFGNACDADYNQDGFGGAPDFVAFRNAFPSVVGAPNFNPDPDQNADGAVAGPDFATFRTLFGVAVGPSALPCAGVAVPCTTP